MPPAEITVNGPDGATLATGDDTTARDALQQMGAIRGQVLAARVDGVIRDLETTLTDGATVEPVGADSDDGREVLRHSVAHIMAQAVTDLYPGAKFAIGPPITDGFYYDFDVDQPFTPEDLQRVEDRMHEIIRENQAFRRR